MEGFLGQELLWGSTGTPAPHAPSATIEFVQVLGSNYQTSQFPHRARWTGFPRISKPPQRQR